MIPLTERTEPSAIIFGLMTVTPFNYFIWILGPCLQTGIAVSMIRKKRHKTYPIFFAYTVFHIVLGVETLLAFRHSYSAYFYSYWIGEIIDAFFTLAVIQELVYVVLESHKALANIGRVLFLVLTIVLCVCALFSADGSSVSGFSHRVAALTIFERSIQFLELGLLFFLLAFCYLFGLSWRHSSFGIAAGFIVASVLLTAASALRVYERTSSQFLSDFVFPLAYTLGTVTWAYYAFSGASHTRLREVPGATQFAAWNRALAQIRPERGSS